MDAAAPQESKQSLLDVLLEEYNQDKALRSSRLLYVHMNRLLHELTFCFAV